MSVYKNILKEMTWSYSRLKCYENCPYSWYRRYIEEETGEGSFYADNGKAMHTVFDELVKGDISINDAPLRYLELFDEITTAVKQDIMDRTYDSCVGYLCELNNDILDGYRVLGSEIQVRYQIYGYSFIGFIDLLLQDSDGNLILVDHKSSAPFLKKDGKPKATSKEQFDGYKKQMYLYSEAIYQSYGEYPKKLVFHHFKDGGKLTVIDFNEKDHDDAINWALGVIEKIYSDEEFIAIPKTGYCYRLCDYRYDCTYTKEDEDE